MDTPLLEPLDYASRKHQDQSWRKILRTLFHILMLYLLFCAVILLGLWCFVLLAMD